MSDKQYGETVTDMSGAYVLNALTPDERTAFERVMAHDENLRAEVTELADTAVLLSEAAPPIMPPAALKIQLMRQIEHTAQQRIDEQRFAEPVMQTAATPPVKKGWRARLMVPVLGFATAAIIAVGAVSVGTTVVAQQQQPSSSLTAIQALQKAPDHETANLSTARGTVTVLWSQDSHQAALKMTNTLKLPNDSIYQLWVIDSKTGKAVSAGMIPSANQNWKIFNEAISKGSKLAMTVEPAGGSKTPTSKAVFTLNV